MLEIRNLSINVNERSLIENFSFTLNAGDKAVIIGEEGNGKSTLLKLIYNEKEIAGYCQHTGQIIKKGRLAYLPQAFPENMLDISIEEFFTDEEHPGLVGSNPQILSQLGLAHGFVTSGQIIRTLSGGEKIKIQLAKILLYRPDILLLDEPTNDIDLSTLKWLEGFIQNSRQPLLFISHDETLIENTANVIIHLEQLMRKTKSKVTITHTGYKEYVKTRNLAFAKQAQVAKKQRSDHKAQMERWQQIYNRVEHEQHAISRQDPSTGRLLKKKMKSVKSTGKRLDKQLEDFLEIPEMEESILTQFDPAITIPQGKVVLSLDLQELRAGGRILAGPIALSVSGPQKIGIIGQNGAGKSTLLREIWAALSQRKNITAAYMPQDYAEVLDYNQPVIEFLASDARKDTITKVRTYLGSMKFTAEEMLGKAGKLSGGQKAKILFLDMVLKKANVLVLDEPTRNFSPLSAPEIRRTLAAFGGAIISVSHDRKYLDEVCERVYEFSGNGLM